MFVNEPWEIELGCTQCGAVEGSITTKAGQDILRCSAGHYQKALNREETGRRARTLSSRPGLTPAQRSRVLAAHGNACVECGRYPPDVELQIEHLISRKDAEAHGCLDHLIDSEWNLVPVCDECNSGSWRLIGGQSIRLMHRVLRIKEKTFGQ